MGSTTFAALISWVISHGYFLFFIAAFLEGPLVTAAAGVASALGYYSLPIIIFLSVMGDLSADIVYYSVGYLGRKTLIAKYGHYIGLHKERVERIENFLKRHAGKAIVIVKLSPLIPIPGLVVIGSAKVPLKKFAVVSLIITLPKSLLFGFLGFYSGRAYERLSATVTNSEYITFGAVLAIILVYWGYKKVSEILAKRLEKNKHILQ